MRPPTAGHFLNEGKDRDTLNWIYSNVPSIVTSVCFYNSTEMGLSLEVKSSTLQGVTEQSSWLTSLQHPQFCSQQPLGRKTERVKDRESAWRAGGVLACQGSPAKTLAEERNEEKFIWGILALQTS